ncbi:MAG: hypothetical protein JXR88_09770 [Clostridia bacterium]|nr:hypothetical protein [Clostridia bacterium]
MAALFGYNLIKQELVVENPFYLYSALKYKEDEWIIKAYQMAISGKKIASINEKILALAKEQGTGYFNVLNHPSQIRQHGMSLQALKKAGYIKTEYKTYFNEKKQPSKLEVLHLSLTDQGEHLNEMLKIKKDLDEESILKDFIAKSRERLNAFSPLTIMKETLIGYFDGIQSACSILPIMDFNFEKPGDLVFDVYTGKIIIKDQMGFKAFMARQNDSQLMDLMKHFVKDTIIHMTEAKMILKALKNNDFTGLNDFMLPSQILHHILYLTNHDYLKLDFEEIVEAQKQNLLVHDYKITASGENYISSDTLIKMKTRLIDQRMLLVLRALAQKEINANTLKQNGLEDLFHPPAVH